jgi:hypothetical protein
MLSPEEIAEQQKLLATYRRTLAIYLKQRAMIGQAYSPPALITGIEETRSNIKRIKATLKAGGTVVPDDPDDESTTATFIRPAALSASSRPRRLWIWLVVVDIVALALAIGGWWWFYGQPTDTASQAATSPAIEEITPPAETPFDVTPSEEPPTTEPSTADLEEQLTAANIALSAVQVEQVREYINDPDTGYKLLAEHALQVVGDQRFRETIFLDELDVRYTELVGEEHFAEFNEDRLKEAMVLAWNGHYTDNKVESFEEIVESRS